jgi:putative proteasome-type protease
MLYRVYLRNGHDKHNLNEEGARRNAGMTYCLGIITRFGLVMASDSRTNAGYDNVNVCRKMHIFETPGERIFVLLVSGSLSLSQSIITLLGRDFDQGQGLASVESMYDAAREIGRQVRRVSDIDRAALEKDDYKFNVHIIVGGQIKGQSHDLYMIYPQGNPLAASEESPFLQIGEAKYGRPILVRGIRYDETPLEEAAKYALISIDSTMRSNATVGPPIDIVLYKSGELEINRRRRMRENDPDLEMIHRQWEMALRKSVNELQPIDFDTFGQKA